MKSKEKEEEGGGEIWLGKRTKWEHRQNRRAWRRWRRLSLGFAKGIECLSFFLSFHPQAANSFLCSCSLSASSPFQHNHYSQCHSLAFLPLHGMHAPTPTCETFIVLPYLHQTFCERSHVGVVWEPSKHVWKSWTEGDM